jgi:hypothetical protein
VNKFLNLIAINELKLIKFNTKMISYLCNLILSTDQNLFCVISWKIYNDLLMMVSGIDKGMFR